MSRLLLLFAIVFVELHTDNHEQPSLQNDLKTSMWNTFWPEIWKLGSAQVGEKIELCGQDKDCFITGLDSRPLGEVLSKTRAPSCQQTWSFLFFHQSLASHS